MRRMYDELYLKSPNASYYLRGRGYRSEDFETMVAQVAGADMSDFFKRYVRRVETPPYEQAFAQAGLRFIREARAPVTIGLTADESEKTNFKVSNVRANSPAADAGLQVDDVITSFGGNKFSSANFLKVLARYKPGDKVPVTFMRGGHSLTTTVTLAPPQVFDYRIEEDANATPQAKALRAAWLGGK